MLRAYPSFATAAFFGLGAYASAIGQLHGLPMLLAWVLVAASGGLLALLLGFGLLRLRGHYFAVASLVVAEVFRELIIAGGDFTGGGMGLNLALLPMTPLAQARLFLLALAYWLILSAVFASAGGAVRLRVPWRSRQLKSWSPRVRWTSTGSSWGSPSSCWPCSCRVA